MLELSYLTVAFVFILNSDLYSHLFFYYTSGHPMRERTLTQMRTRMNLLHLQGLGV